MVLHAETSYVLKRRTAWVCMVATLATMFGRSQLINPDIPDQCLCNIDMKQGWNTLYGSCRKGSYTSCEECRQQRKCANITTLVGDGLRGFSGDCKTLYTGNVDSCQGADKGSLAFPIGMAISADDQLFIADYGNNRIRLVKDGKLVTIAGTGEIGFGGDGGDARRAKLRNPEGIAVHPEYGGFIVRTDGKLKVMFSDLFNQRIRQLTYNGNGITGWTIETVAGSGVKGDTAQCSTGCNPRTAALNNPRAVAFSQKGDLYIADSGNFVIRKLSADLQILETFVGAGSANPSDTWLPLDDKLLPGQWEQNNRDVYTGPVYTLNIDHQDRLWFVSGDTNSLWMAPLRNLSRTLNSGYVGIFKNYFILHFVRNVTDWNNLDSSITQGFEKWLPWESLAGGNAESKSFTLYTEGKSYWRLATATSASTDSHWCPNMRFGQRDKCKDVHGARVTFNSVLGLCFDAADNIYVSDFAASEMMFIRTDNQPITPNNSSERTTTSNCQCRKDWSYNRPQCGATCDVTSYCDGQYVQKCKVTPSDTCTSSVDDLLYCQSVGAQNSFTLITTAAIAGNEIRAFEIIPVNNSWNTIANSMNVHFWVENEIVLSRPAFKITKWSTLIAMTLSAPHCPSPLEVFSQSFSSTVPPANITCGIYADIVSKEQLTEIIASSQAVHLVFNKLESLQITRPVAGAAIAPPTANTRKKSRLQDCKDQCGLDSRCKAFMLDWDPADQEHAVNTTCIFLTQTDPYVIYITDRSTINDTMVAMQPNLDLREFRNRFLGPYYPRVRLLGDFTDLYVGQGRRNASDLLEGPLDNMGLLLDDCKNRCIRNHQCKAIAFPGCYLFSRNNFATQTALAQANQTAIYLKTHSNVIARGIMGYPKVFTYGAVQNLAEQAYLNRPSACVTNQRGDMLFADTWNQRIRALSGYNSRCCTVKASVTKHDVSNFYNVYIPEVTSNCNSVYTADEINNIKQDLLKHNLTLFEQYFCELPKPGTATTPSANSALPAFLDGYTRNLLVLCRVCSSQPSSRRPWPCPAEVLCNCRNSMKLALTSICYTSCSGVDAYHDEWHRWLTAFTTCLWKDSAAADYLTPSMFDQLQNHLNNYTR